MVAVQRDLVPTKGIQESRAVVLACGRERNKERDSNDNVVALALAIWHGNNDIMAAHGFARKFTSRPSKDSSRSAKFLNSALMGFPGFFLLRLVLRDALVMSRVVVMR